MEASRFFYLRIFNTFIFIKKFEEGHLRCYFRINPDKKIQYEWFSFYFYPNFGGKIFLQDFKIKIKVKNGVAEFCPPLLFNLMKKSKRKSKFVLWVKEWEYDNLI